MTGGGQIVGTMVIFIGIQASGKTSFYKRYMRDYEHVSLDVLNTRNKEKLAIEKCIADGRDFVVDNTNPGREERKRYFDMIKDTDYRVVGYYFRSSVGESVERNANRTGKEHVPRCAIAATSNKLELPSFEEGFLELHYVHIENGDFVIEDWSE